MGFVGVEEALAELRRGQMVVVVDDSDRENEGDLTICAEHATPEAVNFMATHGRGLICLSMTEERLDELSIPLVSRRNTSRFGTAFSEPIDAARGVTTGISAADRSRTIRVAIDPATQSADLARPGHVQTLRARRGGVLVRAGQTEAAVDLARLAGSRPAGVICEVMKDDGTMARVPDLLEFCVRHRLKMIKVASLIRYRLEHETCVRTIAEGVADTDFGIFRTIAYGTDLDNEVHIALVHGNPADSDAAMVRMHSHDLFGDVFGSRGNPGYRHIRDSMRMICDDGCGALVYLHHRALGFSIDGSAGKAGKIVPHPQLAWSQTPDGVSRLQYKIGLGAQILKDLGLRRIKLLTNRPRRVGGLEGFGIQIVDQIPIRSTGTPKPAF